MLEHDLVFPHSYEVEGLPDLPGSGRFDLPVLYFPPPKNRPDHNGLWLKMVPPTGKSWIGVFAFLFDSPRSFSRIVSTPDPNSVCIISGSAGYIVKVENPEIWEEVVIPVLSVLPLPAHDLIIFSDFTGLAAYGRNGLSWRSPRLCWDELRIVKVTSNTIEGTGYDPTNSVQRVTFRSRDRNGSFVASMPHHLHGRQASLVAGWSKPVAGEGVAATEVQSLSRLEFFRTLSE